MSEHCVHCGGPADDTEATTAIGSPGGRCRKCRDDVDSFCLRCHRWLPVKEFAFAGCCEGCRRQQTEKDPNCDKCRRGDQHWRCPECGQHDPPHDDEFIPATEAEIEERQRLVGYLCPSITHVALCYRCRCRLEGVPEDPQAQQAAQQAELDRLPEWLKDDLLKDDPDRTFLGQATSPTGDELQRLLLSVPKDDNFDFDEFHDELQRFLTGRLPKDDD